MASDASWALNRSTTSCKATSVIRSQLKTSTSVCQRRRGKVSIIRDKGSHKSSQDKLTMSQKHTQTGHLSSKLFHSGGIGKINRVVLVELFWGRVWKSYLPFVLFPEAPLESWALRKRVWKPSYCLFLWLWS